MTTGIKEYLILILIILGAFAVIGGLSFMFQRRFNFQRNAVLGRVTKKSRAIAIVVAFVFGLAYFIETTFLEQFHSIFLLIAIIALVYSFRKPQDEEN